MNGQKSLIHHLAEAYDRYHVERRTVPRQQTSSGRQGWLGWLGRQMVPNIGTLLVVAGLLWATSVGALPLHVPAAAGTYTVTIAYQGRLADSAGNPITATVNMEFRLYDVPTGGAPLWEELWTGANAVRVSDGLFNVMLGSLNAISQNVIAGHDQLWMGITVDTDDEMAPRVQLGSVPFAVQALTVPDGSVTTAKLADSAITASKIQDGQVKTADLENNAVTSAKIQDGTITQADAPSLVKASNGSARKIQYGRGTISAERCAGIDKYCADITLPEPFQDTHYSVVATPENRHGLRVISKTTTGFRVITDNDFPGYFEFDWIAVGR